MSTETENELSIKLEHLKTVCMEVGALLVRAKIRNVLDSCHLDIDEASFLSVLSHEKPTAVFYDAITYDQESFIRGVMMTHGWKEEWEMNNRESIWPTPDEIKSELHAELTQVSNQIGLPRSLMVTYAVHGQHRICWLTAEWAENLIEKIDEIVEARHERAEAARNEVALALESLIAEVAKDPEFRAIRGRPKRLLYLKAKYGARIPPHPRGHLTSVAQNCNPVDDNIATVLLRADDLTWINENLEE